MIFRSFFGANMSKTFASGGRIWSKVCLRRNILPNYRLRRTFFCQKFAFRSWRSFFSRILWPLYVSFWPILLVDSWYRSWSWFPGGLSPGRGPGPGQRKKCAQPWLGYTFWIRIYACRGKHSQEFAVCESITELEKSGAQ